MFLARLGLLANTCSPEFTMLTDRQHRAVKMLFELSDAEVARKLRIKPETLDGWKRDPEFARAILARVEENRRVVVRILSGVYVEACRELAAFVRSSDDKTKPKLMIEILKASGLFKELGSEEGDYVGRLLERLADETEETEPGEAD